MISKYYSKFYLSILLTIFGINLNACERDTEDDDIMAGDTAGTVAGDTSGTLAGDTSGTVVNLDPECELPTYDVPTGSENIPIQDLTMLASEAVCLKLAECCNEEDLAVYLDLIGFATDQCQQSFTTIFEDYFSPWIERALAGQVKYHDDHAQEYLNSLSQHECSEILWQQVHLKSPQANQVFQAPNSCLGGPCIGLPNNEGYGSCDPEIAFCCVRQADGSCAFADVGQQGECVAVIADGEECSSYGADQLCQPGKVCSDTGPPGEGDSTPFCTSPYEYQELPVGAGCDDDISLYASCIDGSYCSGVCIALKEDGESCVGSRQCQNVCVAQTCRAICQ